TTRTAGGRSAASESPRSDVPRYRPRTSPASFRRGALAASRRRRARAPPRAAIQPIASGEPHVPWRPSSAYTHSVRIRDLDQGVVCHHGIPRRASRVWLHVSRPGRTPACLIYALLLLLNTPALWLDRAAEVCGRIPGHAHVAGRGSRLDRGGTGE